MPESLVIQRKGRSLVLILNRPDHLNAFTVDMHEALINAISNAGHDDELRSLVITGAGRAFCAGQDLNESIAPDGPVSDLGRHLHQYYNPLIRALRGSRLPVIAAVNGVAAGAGSSLALACDIVVAGRSALFIQSFSKIGLVPDSGASWFLPRRVGLQRASALALLGAPLDAETACAWGLIWSVVDDGQLMQTVETIAERLAELPATGIALTKVALNASLDHTLDQQLDLERDMQSTAGAAEDHRRAVQAFMQQRASSKIERPAP